MSKIVWEIPSRESFLAPLTVASLETSRRLADRGLGTGGGGSEAKEEVDVHGA